MDLNAVTSGRSGGQEMRYDDYIERHAPGLPVVFLRLYVGLYFLYCAVTFFSRGTVGTAVFNQRLQELLTFGQLPLFGAYFKMLAGIPTVLGSIIS